MEEKTAAGVIYKGVRSGHPLFEVTVTANGEPLDPRLDLWRHSPSGLNWGYEGSGPAQTSLAILAHHIRVARGEPKFRADALANQFHQRFKVAVVARLHGNEWALTSEQVEKALAVIEAQARGPRT